MSPFARNGDNSFQAAERRFHELQAEREAGRLDDPGFRLEVAKLLLRDEQGTFWMLAPDNGRWFYNQGSGWQPGDPGLATEGFERAPGQSSRRRRRWRLVLAGVLVLLLGLSAASFAWRWPAPLWALLAGGGETGSVRVAIASPPDGSQVAVGQEVAVESTLEAASSRAPLAWVELTVGSEMVDRQAAEFPPAVRQSQPRTLWLSQVWRPEAQGDYELAVVALSAAGARLGSATVSVQVVAGTTEALPTPDCTYAATYVGDVTIPAGMVFPPGARMDKTWQVQNSGSCAWGSGYQLMFVGGEQLGAADGLPVPATAAGGQADLPVTFWAPAASGVYSSAWQLRAPDGTLFGPALMLDVEVKTQAEEGKPPAAPVNLQARVDETGRAVLLSWEDRSDNEDAFRLYRAEIQASIGLAPANAQSFADEQVACGHTYRYTVVAFNAAGGTPSGEAEVNLPPCPPASELPALILTVVPTDVVAAEPFTIVFQASDDVQVAEVRLWGDGTGDPAIDAGLVVTCTDPLCTGYWPLTWTGSPTATLTIVALAVDSSGQESEPALLTIAVRPP